MRVRLAPQVADVVRALAPEPRRRLRQALRELARGRGDVKTLDGPLQKTLDGPLQDYARLRVGPYRVILSYRPRTVDGVFVERRSIVYEVFADAMIDRLTRGR